MNQSVGGTKPCCRERNKVTGALPIGASCVKCSEKGAVGKTEYHATKWRLDFIWYREKKDVEESLKLFPLRVLRRKYGAPNGEDTLPSPLEEGERPLRLLSHSRNNAHDCLVLGVIGKPSG